MLSVLGTFYKIANGLNKSIDSLNYEIKQLNSFMEDSKNDRQKLHARIDKAFERIEKHETDIQILKDWKGGVQHGKFTR